MNEMAQMDYMVKVEVEDKEEDTFFPRYQSTDLSWLLPIENPSSWFGLYHPVLARYNQREWWQRKDEAENPTFSGVQNHLLNPLTTPSIIALKADCLVVKDKRNPSHLYKTFYLEIYDDIINLELYFTYILLRKQFEIISLPPILFLKTYGTNRTEKQFSIGPIFANGIYVTYQRVDKKERDGWSAWERK